MARVGHEPASVDVLAERLATDLASALGDRPLSLAAHGSWVAGDFSPRRSDLDPLAVLDGDPVEADRRRRRRTRSGPLCSGGPSGGGTTTGWTTTRCRPPSPPSSRTWRRASELARDRSVGRDARRLRVGRPNLRCRPSGSETGLVAGTISTTLFVISYLPMLVKAVRTRDLRSYSASNVVVANVGNVVHSAYVFSLPAGPSGCCTRSTSSAAR